MNLTGSVASQTTGKPLTGVTIWEIPPGGQSADVIGYTDSSGNYSVPVEDPGSTINYVIDGYTGVQISVNQAQNSDQILLTPSILLSTMSPLAWLLVLFGLGFIFLGDKKKR